MVTRSNPTTREARSVRLDKVPRPAGAPRIDPEFEKLIPPLKPEELAGLEKSLLREGGCRDALITWNGILLDGYHRLRIIKKYGLPYRTRSMDFPSRDVAKAWIADNQTGRRNLSRFERVVLALQREPWLAAQAKERMLRGKADPAQNSAEGGETRDQVAAYAGVSHDTVDKVRLILKHASEADKAKLRRGELSIREVHGRIYYKLREAEVWKQLESQKKAKELLGLFDWFDIDPAWPEAGGGGGSKPLSYKLMKDLEQVEREVGLLLQKHAAKNCGIFLWTTIPFLPAAIELVKKLGFEYKANFVWHKRGGPQPIGYPQYNHEIVVYATRGSPKFVNTTNFFTCFEAPRGAHSEKPEEWYEMLRRTTAGRRVALYARREIEGFEVWGDQLPRRLAAALRSPVEKESR